MSFNDNDNDDFVTQPPLPVPDPHGQAALLLAESTLHALVEASVLTRLQAVEAVRTASEVKIQMVDLHPEPANMMNESLRLLEAIQQSLENDLL